MSSDGGVTVVIPVWDDHVRFLADAVESVRRNSGEAQIVVVDNASSAPVPQLDDCALVRSPRRLSVGMARNLGLDEVSTKFVVFLDADDMLLNGTLEYLAGRMGADTRLTICATSILDGETGERHRTPRRLAFLLARWPRVFALVDAVWSLLPIHGSALLRTDQVRQAGGYPDAQQGEDWALAASLAWRGPVEISQRLGRYYRSTEGSIAARSWTKTELRANARLVRNRLRSDPAVPGWARVLLPAIAALQLAVIHLARPGYLLLRKLSSRQRLNIR